jgi:hypothetical protein
MRTQSLAQRLKHSVALASVATIALQAPLGWAQTEQAKNPAAPISCTSRVPADVCRHISGAFSMSRHSSVIMKSVEIVIADRQALTEENTRLKSAYLEALKKNPSAPEHSRHLLLSPYDSSILFELGGDGEVARVVISAELFTTVNFDPSASVESQTHAPVEFDKDSTLTWTTYVTGYLEGCAGSRAHILAEAAETARSK